MIDDYTETAAIDIDELVAAGVSEDSIALATRDDEVHVTRQDSWIDIRIDSPVQDVAVGKFVFVLSGSTLTANSDDGELVWQFNLEERGNAVAAILGRSVVCVATDEKLIGVNGTTGEEIFRSPRPHIDAVAAAETAILVGGYGRFIHGAWSFVTTISEEGDVLSDTNLNGRINDLGVFKGRAIVSLQGDRISAIDLESGDRTWSIEQRSRQITPAGGQLFHLITDEGLASIDAQGNITPVPDVTGDAVYATGDGELLCIVADGRAILYRFEPAESGTDTLDAWAVTDRIEEGGELRVRIENTGSQSTKATIDVAAEDVTFGSRSQEVTVSPDSITTLTFSVAEIRGDQSRTVNVVRDGEKVWSSELPVLKDPDLTTEVELESVDHGTATLRVVLENDEGGKVGPVELIGSENGQIPKLGAGDRNTMNVDVDFDPGQTIELGLQGDSWQKKVPVSFPDDPFSSTFQMTIDGEERHQDVRIRNETGVPYVDRIRIELPDGRTIQREIELDPNESVVFVVPARSPVREFDSETVTVVSHGTGVSDTNAVDIESNFPPSYVEGDDVGGPEKSRAADELEDTGTVQHGADANDVDTTESSKGEDPTAPPSEWSPPSAGTEEESVNPRNRDDEGTDGSTQSPGETVTDGESHGDSIERDHHSGTVDEAASPGSTERDDPVLVLERAILGTPLKGRMFEERVRVGVKQAVDELVIEGSGSSLDVGHVDAGDAIVISRKHTPFVDEVRLDGVRATAGSSDIVESLGPDVVEVETSPIEIHGRILPGDDRTTIRLQVENVAEASDESCYVDRVVLDGGGECEFGRDVANLAPGDVVELSETLLRDRVEGFNTGDVVPATVTVIPEISDAGDVQTLFEVVSLSDSRWPLSVNIEPETKVEGKYGTVALNFENRSEHVIDDVVIEASGETVNDLMYAPQERESIGPNQTVVHRVDVKPDGRERLELQIDVSIDGGDRTGTLTVTGPTAREGQWDENMYSEWTVEWESDSNDEPQLPELFSTDWTL